jgi:predicted molibdopterin-dependent oxidoreductase YjgC
MHLTINGRSLTAREGETVLECALRHDISIPHLCTHPNLPPFGACRMCVVEIDGMRGFPASCSTPIQKGMVVRTETAELRELRRGTLELILLEHPSACLVCDKQELCEKYRPKADKTGRTTGCHTCNNKEVCEVRVLSADLKVDSLPFSPIYKNLPLRRSDPFIDRDLNLCILCGRCVRICKHQHETATIDYVSRGSRTYVGTSYDRSLVNAGCRFCGSCVDVCPTGSIADRYSKWHGAPESVTETSCTLCDAACAVKVFVDRGRAVEARAVDGEHPICVLGRFCIPPFLNGAGRLRTPLARIGKVLREVPWDDALKGAAVKLKEFSGGGFAFVCDTTVPLEARHLFRKFTREVMDSPHFLELEPDERGRTLAKLPAGVKAAVMTGNHVEASQLEPLALLVVQDCFPSPATERADFVFPAAVVAEVEGTIKDGTGELRPLRRACPPPGEARPDWWIVSTLAGALEAKGFSYASPKEVAGEAGIADARLRLNGQEVPAAARDPKVRRTHFRGHCLDERVAGLKSLAP